MSYYVVYCMDMNSCRKSVCKGENGHVKRFLTKAAAERYAKKCRERYDENYCFWVRKVC